MEKQLIEKVNEKINNILKEDINTNNLDHLYKLTKIKHMTKEDENMYGNYGARYSNYGNNYGRDEYGNYGAYNNYGRRGYDSRYRGHDYIDKMNNEYGRYMESRERYGAGEESDKAFHFMAKALGEYIEFLFDEAQTPQQKQMLNETIQRSMR